MNITVIDGIKKFDEFTLDHISLTVPKGKIVGLIGENGAGKTTLIKCIIDAMHFDSGEVFLFDEPYKASLKEDVGVVFDHSFMNETFTIKDINRIMKNIYKNWDSKMFFQYMKEFKIPLTKELKRLSTGMKKKVEIASALSHHPKLLILDEPTSGLDPIIRSEILELFENFVANRENSILLSTHITSDLEHIADEVIFISKGKVIFNRPLKDIKSDYIMLEMNHDEFSNLPKEDIIRFKKNRLDYQVLVHKKAMKKRYEKYQSRYTTLDDIMLLYIKGEEV